MPLWVAALLCGVSLLRVDWPKEAVAARKASLAAEAERLQHEAETGSDLEQAVAEETVPSSSSSPGDCCSCEFMA